MRLAFFGSDAIALPALAFLRGAPGVELAGVVSQPDRPAGRGRHLHANPVTAWAREAGVKLWQPEKPGAELVAGLRAERVEAVLVMAYGHILRRDLLDAPPRGVWNLHASLLPAYRGASPVEAALAAGETETGVCLMRVVPALDAGPVADCARVPIRNNDTGAALRARLGEAGVPLLARNLAALAAGTLPAAPQDDARATYTRKLTKADAGLDFNAPAAALARRIRALQPWPGAAFGHDGLTLRIGEAEADLVADDAASELSLGLLPRPAAPGTVVYSGETGLGVTTAEGVLRLTALQRPGGRMLPAAEFLRGHPIPPLTVLPDGAMPPLVSPTPFPRPAKPPA